MKYDDDEELRRKVYRIDAALSASRKAGWAHYQTGDGGRKRTIICVDHDEAVVIKWALDAYINKYRMDGDKDV